MARNITRLQNLTRLTTLEDSDVFAIGPGDGDRAKGIPFNDFLDVLRQRLVIETDLIINASSFNNQNPVGTDNPLQIEFGPAVNNLTDPVQMDANGLVTINQTDEYAVSFFFEYGRSGSGNVSWLFWRLKVNGVQSGNSVFAKLDGSNDDVPVQFEIARKFNEDDFFTVELMRDSQGNNSGGLLSETPTPIDWNPAPSANIVIRRVVIQ